jgi:hypothetical protein
MIVLCYTGIMPTISIFIRQGDLLSWKALKNKSQWLHDNLPKADDESLAGQLLAEGFTFIEEVDDQAHAKNSKGEDIWFDVKFGRVLF